MKESVISYLQDRMIIDNGGSFYRLFYSEICYISYFDFYTHLFTAEKKELLICCSLSKLKYSLPAVFVQCNKSAIVNMSYVKLVEINDKDSFLLLEDNTLLHLSRRRCKDVKVAFQLVSESSKCCKDCFKCMLNQKPEIIKE